MNTVKPTTVQAVTSAVRAAGLPIYRARTGRTVEVPGVKVRGHFSMSRDGLGLVCVNCDQSGDDAMGMAERVHAALAGSFAASFDKDHGSVTGVVFVSAL